MAWEEIGENVYDKIYKLEQQVEDLKEDAYTTFYNSSESVGADSSATDSVDSGLGFTNTLTGAVSLTPEIQVRTNNETYDGSTIYDSIFAFNPYIIVKAKGDESTSNIIEIKWIRQAQHDGQILILEPFYKAGGNSNTTSYTLRLKTAGNINISSDTDVAKDEKIFLQWSENFPITNSSSGSWTVISQTSGGGSSSWVGLATSNLDMGNFNIEDVNALKINSGSANSTEALSIYGTSSQGVINLIDDSDSFIIAVDGASKFEITDTWNRSHQTLNMDGNNIQGVNTLFINASGTNDAHIIGSSNGLDYKVATGDKHRFVINNTVKVELDDSGSDPIFKCNTIAQFGLDDGDYIQLGNNISSYQIYLGGRIMNDIVIDSGKQIKSYDSTEIGIHVSNNSDKGTKGTLEGPYDESTSFPSQSNLDDLFGEDEGSIGVYEDTNATTNYKVRFYYRGGDGWYAITGAKV